MFEYILRLLILLPIVGGMAWGSLWLWKRVQMGVPLVGGATRSRAVEMVDVLPLGPGHGLNALLDRIDGRPRRARPVARIVPWIGYGLAAGLGGGIVWFWLALAPIGGGDRGEGAFETLSTPATTEATPSVAAPAAAQIDVVFAAAVSGTELEAFGSDSLVGRTKSRGGFLAVPYTWHLQSPHSTTTLPGLHLPHLQPSPSFREK